MLISPVVEIIQWLGVHHFWFMTTLDSFTVSRVFLSFSWKNVSNGNWSVTALGYQFVPGSASSPSIPRTYSKFLHFFFPKCFPLLSFPILSRGLSLKHAKCSQSACWSIISSSTKQLTRISQFLDSILTKSYVSLLALILVEGARPFYKACLSVWALNLIFG